MREAVNDTFFMADMPALKTQIINQQKSQFDYIEVNQIKPYNLY